MKFDLVTVNDLLETALIAKTAEAAGFDGLWSSESGNDPFLPLAIAADQTHRIQVGTAVTVAFGRSPMTVAYSAWDLARLSHGRFILGLGTQVKGHIERRYGMPWGAPAARMREYIEALRAIFECWAAGGSRLSYQGQFYRFSLMTPFFTPPMHDHWRIPIYLSGLNRQISRLAGELCEGFIVHPFHTARYLREQVMPNIEQGLGRAGRRRQDFSIASTVFVILGTSDEERAREREAIRRQLAFYASTRTYKPVFDLHGWGEVTLRLNELAAKGEWERMTAEVSDEIVDTFAMTGSPAEIRRQVEARYDGLLDRVAFYHWNTAPGPAWREVVEAFKG
jgi:probable F420-dependent oxidoreductase